MADLLAETAEGKLALRGLAEDDGVMLSLLLRSMREIRIQTVGAAAVEVVTELAWDVLAKYLGDEMLIRRTSELQHSVDRGRAVSSAEASAFASARDYAAGKRPEHPFCSG